MQRNRHFADLSPSQAGFDNHLGCELHALTSQIESLVKRRNSQLFVLPVSTNVVTLDAARYYRVKA